jgi:hypothetical protein
VLDGSVAEAIRSHAEMRHIPIEES